MDTQILHAEAPQKRALASAVIIGAGLNGLKAAWALAAHGVKVSVFDRGVVSAPATAALRWMLQRSAAVRVVGRTDVIELLRSPDDRVVQGVIVWLRGLHAAEFAADLVIDATEGPPPFYVPVGCVGYVRFGETLPAVDESNHLALAH